MVVVATFFAYDVVITDYLAAKSRVVTYKVAVAKMLLLPMMMLLLLPLMLLWSTCGDVITDDVVTDDVVITNDVIINYVVITNFKTADLFPVVSFHLITRFLWVEKAIITERLPTI